MARLRWFTPSFTRALQTTIHRTHTKVKSLALVSTNYLVLLCRLTAFTWSSKISVPRQTTTRMMTVTAISSLVESKPFLQRTLFSMQRSSTSPLKLTMKTHPLRWAQVSQWQTVKRSTLQDSTLATASDIRLQQTEVLLLWYGTLNLIKSITFQVSWPSVRPTMAVSGTKATVTNLSALRKTTVDSTEQESTLAILTLQATINCVALLDLNRSTSTIRIGRSLMHHNRTINTWPNWVAQEYAITK